LITAWIVILGWVPAAHSLGAIPIEGVENQEVYTDQVSFRVPAEAGFTYTVELNGEPLPADVSIQVDRADYYELFVRRTEDGTESEETVLVQFIVRASERKNSEWGLSPWVPYPVIDSAAEEFAGSQLHIVVPREYPLDLEIPVVALVRDAGGKRVGVNGIITAAAFPGHSFQLYRGVGHGFLPGASEAGILSYTPEVKGLQAPGEITIEASTDWIPVSGDLSSSTDWGEDARIHIDGDLTIAGGATLTIGAGSVIQLGPGVEVTVNGEIQVAGTPERPVVFTPISRDAPWGGLLFLSGESRGDFSGTIFTGGCSNRSWFSEHSGYHTHRSEQSLLLLDTDARVELTDCYLVDNQGQAGHGEEAYLTMTRCLVQNAITTGQYNGGSVIMVETALVGFPHPDAPFADDDNDGLYFTEGDHSLTDCLLGWALDDCIDAGSGGFGSVQMTGCWVEACYHEGMAWSGNSGRDVTVRDCVVVNCGQGIECGWGSPQVDADHCLSTANLIGTRHGDNYDWDYDGTLKLRNSLILYNEKNIFGFNWDDWTEHLSLMDLQQNYLSQADPTYPDNAVWDPAEDAFRLEPFLAAPDDVVGVGIALSGDQQDFGEISRGLPVRLSSFSRNTVSLQYSLTTEEGPQGGGTLELSPGETVKNMDLESLVKAAGIEDHNILRVTLANPVNGELTGRREVYYLRNVTLIPEGSRWKYFDGGEDQGTEWRALEFPDDSWGEGPAELGCGDGDEATPLDCGPGDDRNPTTYFRKTFQVANPAVFSNLVIHLRRDDGAVVYINGEEAFRSNMPDPPEVIAYSTWAADVADDEDMFYTKDVDPAMLVAGENIIAVEIHQANRTSSDISFELKLIGIPSASMAPGFIRGDANGDGEIDISDALKVLFTLFAASPTDCQDAIDADDNGQMEITDAIRILEYLFKSGPPFSLPFPGAGEDPTDDDLGCSRT